MNRFKLSYCSLALILTVILMYGIANAQDMPSKEEILEQHEYLRLSKIKSMESLFKAQSPQEDVSYGNYDVKHYDIDLTFNRSNQTVTGRVIMTALALENLDSIYIDLTSQMSISVLGEDVDAYARVGHKLKLYFKGQVSADSLFKISVSYSGSPIAGGGLDGLTFDNHATGPIISSLSEPYGARSWWACKDVPNDKPDSVDIWITVDSTLTAISNGSLITIVNNGDGTSTTHWHEKYPIATYLVSVAISNYVYYEDIHIFANGDTLPIPLWIYPNDPRGALNLFHRTKDMVALFDSVFGKYPFPDEKYGMAQFGWGGAMEHQTVSSMGRFGIGINSHELAHQWWGDMVTCANWGNIWLNEGFASYSEGLWYENEGGSVGLINYMRAIDNTFSNRPIFTPDTTNIWGIFNGIVYHKGAWVLHMLRGILGDEDFFDGLIAYRERYFMKSATTENLRDVMEEVSGKELDSFFESWIYGTGRPNYSWTWWQTKNPASGKYDIGIDLEQTQVASVFQMPISFGFFTSAGDTIVTVNNTDRIQRFVITGLDSVKRASMDPNSWLLKHTTFYFTGIKPVISTIPMEFKVGQNYPNPFNMSTLMRVSLPQGARLRMDIFDIRGRRVKNVVDHDVAGGVYEFSWNGLTESGKKAPTGIYFYKVTAYSHTPGATRLLYSDKKKMVLLK